VCSTCTDISEDAADFMIDGLKYYDHRNKKGYLLILEARENRSGKHLIIALQMHG